MRLNCVLFSLVSLLSLPIHLASAEKTSRQYLEDGNSFLVAGRLDDALESFDSAISLDPDNYLSYFKRAATYLSLGRQSSAVEDFSKVLALRPDFDQALLQRGKILAKNGDFDRAKADLGQYIKSHPADEEVVELHDSIKDADSLIVKAEKSLKSRAFDKCIDNLSLVISVAPNYARPRLLRAKCHVGKGEIEEAVGDFTRASSINPSDPTTLIVLASLSYFALYEPAVALSHVKQCLHYDPEQKECKALFRKIKSLEKSIAKLQGDMEGARFVTVHKTLVGSPATDKPGLISEIDEEYRKLESTIDAAGKLPKNLSVMLYGMACKAYIGQKDASNALKWCSNTLKLDEDNVDAMLNRAEAYILDSLFEDALKDLNKARDITNGQDRRVLEALNRAQQLLKVSKRKDYYKLLDIPRSATKKDVKKAYRKAVMQWHPDKYTGNLPKDVVERKTAEINEAYEVLYDDSLRQRYDSGEDPFGSDNTPFQGSPFGQDNPFAGFQGFQFGQGGSQYQFQFNFP